MQCTNAATLKGKKVILLILEVQTMKNKVHQWLLFIWSIAVESLFFLADDFLPVLWKTKFLYLARLSREYLLFIRVPYDLSISTKICPEWVYSWEIIVLGFQNIPLYVSVL